MLLLLLLLSSPSSLVPQESFCCESSSKQLSTNRLVAALNEIQNAIDIVVRKHDEAPPSEKNSLAAQKIDLETLRGLITMLATRIDEIEIKDGQKGFEKPFSYFLQLLHSINIDHDSVHQPVSVLQGAQLLLENDSGGKVYYFTLVQYVIVYISSSIKYPNPLSPSLRSLSSIRVWRFCARMGYKTSAEHPRAIRVWTLFVCFLFLKKHQVFERKKNFASK